jgi:hypothetical protein
MIAPVNVPPSQLQIIQGSSLDKSASSAPDLNSAPNLKKRTLPVLQIARASTTLNQAVLAAQPQDEATPQAPGTEAEPTQFPKARMLPFPLVSPKELPKSEESKSGQLDPNLQPLTPDGQPQKPDQLLPNSQPPEAKPESKEQQKPEVKPLVPDAKEEQKPDQLLPNSQPPETKPESKEQQKPEAKPLVPDAKEEQKPNMPESQPAEDPGAKQESKPTPPPLPSEVFPAPSQQPQSPLPSGPPSSEPGNYPNNTGSGAAYFNQNYIAPSVSLGKDTLIGATSRFGIGRNLSVRPSLFLGNSARIAVPLTYDFGFNENEQFEKNPLVVFHAGGGLDYSTKSGSNTSSLNPLVVFGADVYLGDGASILLQIGNTFNSDFIAVVGVGLQF